MSLSASPNVDPGVIPPGKIMSYFASLLATKPMIYPSAPSVHQAFRAMAPMEQKAKSRDHFQIPEVSDFIKRLSWVELYHIAELERCLEHLPNVKDPHDRRKLQVKIENWLKLIRNNLSDIAVHNILFENICYKYRLGEAHQVADEFGGVAYGYEQKTKH